MTEKSVLADAVQLSFGRRGEKAAEAIEAKPESPSGVNGASRESYDCSAATRHGLCRSWSARADERLGVLEDGF